MKRPNISQGSWNIKLASEYTDDPNDTQIMGIDSENGDTILYTDSGYFKPKPENAKAIAAVPQLLEVLENIAGGESQCPWAEAKAALLAAGYTE
jgi:hypothetical protein